MKPIGSFFLIAALFSTTQAASVWFLVCNKTCTGNSDDTGDFLHNSLYFYWPETQKHMAHDPADPDSLRCTFDFAHYEKPVTKFATFVDSI